MPPRSPSWLFASLLVVMTAVGTTVLVGVLLVLGALSDYGFALLPSFIVSIAVESDLESCSLCYPPMDWCGLRPVNRSRALLSTPSRGLLTTSLSA